MADDLVVVTPERLRALVSEAVVEALAGKVGRASLDERRAAAYCGIGRSTLSVLRQRGEGPAFGVRGGRVVYDQRDLDSWCDATRIVPSGAACSGPRKRGGGRA